MAQFRILEGKALKAAIKSGAKKIATFAQLQHELCYGAVLHLEKHNDPVYVQAVYDMMPTNYRKAVRVWFTALGKCAFDANDGTFTYAKSKKSDMDTALATSPADFEKEGSKRGNNEFEEVKYLESVLKKLTEKGASPRVLKAMQGVVNVAKAPQVVADNTQKKDAA